MSASELSEELKRFLHTTIPTFPAAELLIFLADRAVIPSRTEEIVEAIKPIVISSATVNEYIRLFKEQGLVTGDPDTGYRFAAASAEAQFAVKQLIEAYNERPVTLIRTIYAVTENKIQSFADSFKLKKE